MSLSNTASNEIPAHQAKSLCAAAGRALAWTILRRATRQVHRELAALDERRLSDAGPNRGEQKSYPTVLSTNLDR